MSLRRGKFAIIPCRNGVKTTEKLVITNTLMHSEKFLKRNPYITKLDALKIFSQGIFETHVDGSISRLYNTKLRE